jgi:hypothetical protein
MKCNDKLALESGLTSNVNAKEKVIFPLSTWQTAETIIIITEK